MINKIPRRLNSSGRLSLTKALAEYVHLEGDRVALCKTEVSENEIRVIAVGNIQPNDIVISIVSMDDKKRIILPLEIRKNVENWEVYIRDRELYIKEC